MAVYWVKMHAINQCKICSLESSFLLSRVHFRSALPFQIHLIAWISAVKENAPYTMILTTLDLFWTFPSFNVLEQKYEYSVLYRINRWFHIIHSFRKLFRNCPSQPIQSRSISLTMLPKCSSLMTWCIAGFSRRHHVAIISAYKRGEQAPIPESVGALQISVIRIRTSNILQYPVSRCSELVAGSVKFRDPSPTVRAV